MTTSDIVKDLIAHRLAEAGYADLIQACNNPTPAMRTMRILGHSVSSNYDVNLTNVVNQVTLSEDAIRNEFQTVVNHMLVDGVNWGRIIGLIVFASHLAVRAMELGRPDMVHTIINMTIEMLESPRLDNWIGQNNGWAGFVRYFKSPINERNNNYHEDAVTWGKLATAGIATIAGAAAVFNFMRRS